MGAVQAVGLDGANRLAYGGRADIEVAGLGDGPRGSIDRGKGI